MAGRNVWGTKRNRWGAQESEGGGVAESIQKSVLPTPTAADLGKIYQYVGATTADYTNGYFYKCVTVNPGDITERIEWQAVDVDSVSFSELQGSPSQNAALTAALVAKADASRLTSHTDNTGIHVTASDKTAWNGKADASSLTSHTGDTSIHVTASDKTNWNTKVFSLDFGQNEDTINVVNVFGAVNITEVVTNGNVATIKLSHGSTVQQPVTPGTQATQIAIAAGETMIWDITRTTASTAAALGIKFTIGG